MRVGGILWGRPPRRGGAAKTSLSFRRFLITNGIIPLRSTPSQYLYLGRLCSQQDSILAFCQRHGIQNVIWLSGDSHTSVINDDKNAGFPELMAGNLRQTNSRLAWLMNNAGPLTSTFCPQANLSQSFALWNAGGQGLGNTNFNNAYGRIEVFGTGLRSALHRRYSRHRDR
jgi:hypothetical protein